MNIDHKSETQKPRQKYTFHKSSRDGEADVYYNGHSLPNLPYHVAEELCTAANLHYALQSENQRLTEEIEQMHNRILVHWKKTFGSIHSDQKMDAYTVSGFVRAALETKQKIQTPEP